MENWKMCPDCNGARHKPGDENSVCDTCKGEAIIKLDKVELKPNEYQCARCHGVFGKGLSEEEARAEQVANGWGDIPDEDTALVCDDSYKEMTGILSPADANKMLLGLKPVVVKMCKDILPLLSQDDRVAFFRECFEGYCEKCGQRTEGICQCENDE